MHTLPKTLLVTLALALIGTTPLRAGEPATDAAAPAKDAKPQYTCPVMGGEIGPKDKALYVDVKGKRIYICCAACENAVKAEPEKYIKKLEQRGEIIEDAPKP